jgi:antitoxin (DNA-binding transcriptional repressor) of toxin-antitoxin stability system
MLMPILSLPIPLKFWYTIFMATITLDEIQRDLLGCLQRVRAGETLLITEANTPVAEIRPITSTAEQPRPLGLCRGEFVTPEDFDAPLSAEVLAEFEGR